jgi:hypothetical protein
MTHASSRAWRSRSALTALALVATASFAHAQGAPEVYNATASLKTAAGVSITAPVIISISGWTTDGDREKAVAALKAGGTTALRKQLATVPDAGFLQVGQVKTPLRFARTLPVGDGKLVTLATAQPVFHIGGGAPDAKPADKAGYDVAVVIFQVDAAGKGEAGDFSPAAKVKFDERGALIVEDYAAEAVRLTGITKKK